MEEQYEKKITWTIKNFSSLPSKEIYSDYFIVGDSKWRLLAYPKGNGYGINKSLSLLLDVADSESLPDGWKRHIKYRLTVVNQKSEKLSKQKGDSFYICLTMFPRRTKVKCLCCSEILLGQPWFAQKLPSLGLQSMLPLNELLDVNGGFMVNGEVKIVAEVCVLEVVGKSDVLVETLLVHESIDINGFQVLPSQVESVNSLFEDHPDIASNFRLENPLLRTQYMNSLLHLTEILCQSPQKLSNVDLVNAYSTLSYVTKAGFKLDWLEKKLKEIGETRVQDIEEELKDMKQKCADMEALLEFLR
ncbi:putative MATH/TRAF domain-containing protein [Arabidopsis thaliana]